MAELTRFLVGRQALRDVRWDTQPLPERLGADEVLLAIDHFALTANNITYAVAGDRMHYWQFFPVDETWGQIPVWGFAEVVASAHSEIKVGERFYGYFPIATHVRLQAGHVTTRALVDVSAHRQGLAPVYNQYLRVSRDPGYRREDDAAQMLYRPLFTTSFLLDDFLDQEDFFGAESVVLTSASSKTALGLAWLLHGRRQARVQVIGLTSPANRAFLQGLGCYDRVLGYDEVDAVPLRPTVIVDMAGNGEVLARLHNHLDQALVYSCLVGATHWDARAGARDMKGPAPQLFFAPAHIERRRESWGAAGFEARVATAWGEFVAQANQWIQVECGRGRQAVEGIYFELLDGTAAPDKGHVLTLAE
jgi:hypothetical protein